MKLTQIRRTYRRMAPIYDPLFRRFYRRFRMESIAALHLQPSDTILLVGAGTGLDVPFLPSGSRTIAIDVTPAMLKRAAVTRPRGVDFILADGVALPLRDASVSAVILHLVLSVAPDPAALLSEAARVVRVDGRVAVLDHFAPASRLSLARRLLARVPCLLGTHVDRRFEDLAGEKYFEVLQDRLLAGGAYRALTLGRRSD
ncbi:MAG: class I SAM-dependent methyltransferase [Dehalococcoidia bacterium]